MEIFFPYHDYMTTLLRKSNWLIKVHGDEHPPVHYHVRTPDGEALIYLNGTIINNGVALHIMAEARLWAAENEQAIIDAWHILNRERRR